MQYMTFYLILLCTIGLFVIAILNLKKKIVIKRFLEDDPEDSWVHPVSDIMTINSEKVYDELLD